MNRNVFSGAAVAALTAGLAFAAAPATAQSGDVSYEGERVTFIVGYAAGGGYDTYARLAAPHFARNLPGNPSIAVQNMPGADSLTALNYLYNRAPKDGTTIGTFSRSLPVAPLLGQLDASKVHFDPSKLTWIGSFNNEVSVVAIRADAGINTIQDAMEREVVVGATGLTSNNAVYPYVSNNVLGTRFKVIVGYPGTSHMTLAMERGEISGNAGWSWSSLLTQHREWYENGDIKVLMQLSTDKHPDLPNVPLIMDFAKNETDRAALELIFSPLAMGRPLAAPPGIPAARRDALRAAFDATLKDPAFVAQAERAQMNVTPVRGEAIERLVSNMYSTSPDVVARAQEVVQRGGTEVGEAVIPFEKVRAELSAVENGGRVIRFQADGKKSKASISGSRTNVTVGGEKAKRSVLKAGMMCEVDYQGSGSTARNVACD